MNNRSYEEYKEYLDNKTYQNAVKKEKEYMKLLFKKEAEGVDIQTDKEVLALWHECNNEWKRIAKYHHGQRK